MLQVDLYIACFATCRQNRSTLRLFTLLVTTRGQDATVIVYYVSIYGHRVAVERKCRSFARHHVCTSAGRIYTFAVTKL